MAEQPGSRSRDSGFQDIIEVVQVDDADGASRRAGSGWRLLAVAGANVIGQAPHFMYSLGWERRDGTPRHPPSSSASPAGAPRTEQEYRGIFPGLKLPWQK